jgi:hypothetical protein
MILILLAIIAGSLSTLTAMAITGKFTGPPGPQGERGEPGRPGRDALSEHSPHAAAGITQVLKASPDGWEHDHWVREASDAERHAYDTPGLAIRRHGQEIDPGVQ